MEDFPLKPTASNVEVIGVGVAENFGDAELLREAEKVCSELRTLYQKRQPFLRQFVQLGNEMVGVVMERHGVFTIFIGLGLEVIHATHNFE